MKLRDWLKAVNMTTDDFALVIKVCGGTVRRYASETRTPRKAIKVRIRNATNGRVRFRDWPDWDPEDDQIEEAQEAA